MENRSCENCKYYRSNYNEFLDKDGKDICSTCNAEHSENGQDTYPNWEHVDSISCSFLDKEDKNNCENCKHRGDLVGICAWCKSHSSVSCPYPRWAAWEAKDKKESEWYIEALKEGLRQAEEPKKSSGRYPWGEARKVHSYSGWVNEILANKDALYSVDEIHPAIDLILKANIADELHRLKDILIKMERKK